MKKLSIIYLLILFIMGVWIPHPHAASTLKIGVFDLQKIKRESKVIQEYLKTLGKEMEPKRKLLAEKQDSIKLIEEKLKRDDKSTPPDERKRLLERHARESKEFQRLKEDFEIELQKIDRELSQRVLREIVEITRNFAQKEKYTLVFEKAQAGIAYSEDSVDITQKIIEAYDAKK